MIEDATCPSHALIPFDSPLDTVRDIMPPPPDARKVNLHTIMETRAPAVDLAGRTPRKLDDNELLDEIYAGVRSTRGILLETVRAAYVRDEKGMDPGRRQAALTGAQILADALYEADLAAK